jgi:hypothetical protein
MSDTERQARKDAMADAETLRINIGISDYSPEFQCWIGSPSTYALNRAVMNADMAIRGASDFAAERATMAAHDAFRVVPALKEGNE